MSAGGWPPTPTRPRHIVASACSRDHMCPQMQPQHTHAPAVHTPVCPREHAHTPRKLLPAAPLMALWSVKGPGRNAWSRFKYRLCLLWAARPLLVASPVWASVSPSINCGRLHSTLKCCSEDEGTSPRPVKSNRKPRAHTSSFEFPGGPYEKGFNCDTQLVAAVLDRPALDERPRVGAGAGRPEPLKE